ncbi:calreticulin, putative [Leishmania donovani]|uniref:Calreticulin n=1 Tax=Leishmania donovani TaxID=5661 RepID=A0A3S7X4V0_LEIDO|nr:calreticulin, putative [Leishmania donovani]
MAQRAMLAAVVGVLVLCVYVVQAEIFFHEEFNTMDGWVQSEHTSDYGKVALSVGAIHVDAEKEQGLKLMEDAKFYAVSKKLPKAVSNDGKSIVVSFSVKNEQKLTCGGTYLKFFSELDQKDLHGESAYWLMFGPDTCGSSTRLQFILSYNGTNHLWKKLWRPKTDKATHVYTVEIAPNNTYQLYVDGMHIQEGSFEEEWDMLPPKTIPDPTDEKPADWVDDMMMDDPSDTKPEHWDDEPATITDSEAVKPVDWDDAEDGVWEAPKIPNPNYRGAWTPRRIHNPDYKGKWAARQIPNPAYKEDPNLYRAPAPLQYVGIDVWQVEGGSIFDDIIIGDDITEVLGVVKSTYGAMAEKERDLIQAEEKEATKEPAEAAAEKPNVGEHADHTPDEGDSEDKEDL